MYGYVGPCRTMQGCVWLCMAMQDYVGLCSAVYGYVRLCRAMYGYVGLCRAMQGYVRICRAEYGCVWLCRAMQGCVWLCKAMQSNVHCILINGEPLYDAYTTYLPLQLVQIKSTEGFYREKVIGTHQFALLPLNTTSEVTCTNEVSFLEALGSPAKLCFEALNTGTLHRQTLF